MALKQLNGSKGFLESKATLFAIFTVIATVLGFFGFDVDKQDFITIIEYLAPVATAAVIAWKRFQDKIKTFDLTAWILAIIGAIMAVYVSITGDTETADTLLKAVTGIVTAVFSILSAFGLHVAKDKITVF